MFDTLIESTAARHTRPGFTLMSVVVHVALVAAAAAVTASAGSPDAAPVKPQVVDVIYTIPERPPLAPSLGRREAAGREGASPVPTLPPLDGTLPNLAIPADLPSIDELHVGSPVPESMPGSPGTGPLTGSYLGSGTVGAGVMTPDMVERVVALRTSASPDYPPALRKLGIEGTVRVRFVVDTLGRVEPASVDVRASPHEALSESVRAVLPRLRFAPAQVAGRPVRQLVEMPFVFSLRS